MHRHALLSLLFPLLKTSTAEYGHRRSVSNITTLVRDVCIIGGGSSGTYSAIRLQQMGLSVALVEREERLGGHVNTYIDPTTNVTFDYGVQAFDNISVVRDYFSHLNVPLGLVEAQRGSVTVLADFKNASVAPASILAQGNFTAALLTYNEQLAKYPYLINGFNLPNPVPDDLLLTWGDFIEKYSLGAIAYTAFEYLQGSGNILAQPMLYLFKYFNAPLVQNLMTGDFVAPIHHDSQQLYNNALVELGSDALLSSNVTKITRGGDCVEVVVSTPDGQVLVMASKLLITIPPKLSNLGFLDLDHNERNIFGQFNNSYYWDAVVKNAGILGNTSIDDVDPAAPYGIPPMPGIYGFGSVAALPELHTVYYSSPYALSDDEVKADILATNARLVKSLGYPSINGTPEFVGFNAHNPFELTVSVEAIKDGFYGRLESLQGRRNTWWTGATWQAQDSSVIWNFTENVVLPEIVA